MLRINWCTHRCILYLWVSDSRNRSWLIVYRLDEAGGNLKFDKESSSIIRLNHAGGNEDNIVLYLREVDKCLALVCLINEREFHKQHLINYNIDRFKEGLKKIFQATQKALKK
jgi:hypothetical protein